MSKNLPNMLETTIGKIREMVDANAVVGAPITTADGVTIIPISKISVGVGGTGSDYVSKHPNKQDNPFVGASGGGVKVTPIAFLVIKEGSVRVLPIPTPPSTTTDRLVEQIPDFLDRISAFIDERTGKKGE